MFLSARVLGICLLLNWMQLPVIFSARAAERNSKAAAMALLKGNCFGCHNEEKKKGGLLLTSRKDLLRGGENGPVVVAGKGEQSKLIQVLAAESDPHMPPKKQLTEKQISALRRWIDEGAAWDEKALATFGTETPLEKLGSLPGDYDPVLALSLSPDGKHLAVARGNEIVVYPATGTNCEPITQFRGHRDAVQSLAWNRDGKRLASGSYRELFVWNSTSWQSEQRLTNSLVGRLTALAFSPDGDSLYGADGVVTRNGIVHVWETESWNLKSTWEAHRDSIMAMEVSHNGKFLATASTDKLVKLWNLPSQTEAAKFERHQGHVLALGFSPDDSMLATASADKVLNLWDTKTKEQKITVPKHPAVLTGLAWAADGKSLVSAAEDGAPRIYSDFKSHSGKEQSEGAQTRALTSINEVLYCVAISADGKTVYGGAYDGVVYVWNSDGKVKSKLAPGAAKRQLAATEGPR